MQTTMTLLYFDEAFRLRCEQPELLVVDLMENLTKCMGII